MPSNESRPSAGRTTTFSAPTPPDVVPATRSKTTPVVASGFAISSSQPVVPFSSPAITVPQGVARTGSQALVPVRMVSTAPSESRIRCRPGCAGPSSLQAIRCVGCAAFGHGTIMSMLGPRAAFAETTLARRPFATVTRAAGFASAVTASMLASDDSFTGASTPNSWNETRRVSSSFQSPKSKLPPSAAADVATPAIASARPSPIRFMCPSFWVSKRADSRGRRSRRHDERRRARRRVDCGGRARCAVASRDRAEGVESDRPDVAHRYGGMMVDRERISAADALARLVEGNARFVRGESRHTRTTPEVLADLAEAQRPYATILGCSDSRVSPELLFDAGFGELFIIRVAGNVVAPEIMGSLQYAGTHLETQLIVVLGHEGCGAVQAALAAKFQGVRQLSRIALLLEDILPGLDRRRSAASAGAAASAGGRGQRPLVHAPAPRDARRPRANGRGPHRAGGGRVRDRHRASAAARLTPCGAKLAPSPGGQRA